MQGISLLILRHNGQKNSYTDRKYLRCLSI